MSMYNFKKIMVVPPAKVSDNHTQTTYNLLFIRITINKHNLQPLEYKKKLRINMNDPFLFAGLHRYYAIENTTKNTNSCAQRL